MKILFQVEVQILKGKHWECKYCDCTSKSESSYEEKGFYVCSRCGTEWEDCKILVEDEITMMSIK